MALGPFSAARWQASMLKYNFAKLRENIIGSSYMDVAIIHLDGSQLSRRGWVADGVTHPALITTQSPNLGIVCTEYIPVTM